MATEFKACCIDGCKGDAQRSQGGARGMCRRHYNRLRKYGDPLGGPTFNGDLKSFLLNTVLHFDSEECLLWPYALDKGGYPAVGKSKAHRVVCEQIHGEPPTPEHQAAHSCGKRACVNWRNLRWATPSENQRDRLIHGTHNRGERCKLAKITEEQAREIISLRGKFPARVIAEKYPISQSAVTAIHLGNSWAWIPRD